MTDEQSFPRLAGSLTPKKLGELSVAEMRQVIESLAPDSDMHQGIKFLTKLLESKGVPGVIEFVEKVHVILDKEGKLAEYDLSASEKRLLRQCAPNLFNRRQALTNIGYGLGGATLVAYGGMEIAGNFTRKEEEKPTGRRGFMRRVLADWAVPVFAEVGIGAALMNEVVKDWREMKLEHVANAIAELAERMAQEKQERQPAR